MNRAIFSLLMCISLVGNSAKAQILFIFSPTPPNAASETRVTIESGWQEIIEIFEDLPAYASNVQVDGNIVTLVVTGGGGIFFFPTRFTHTVNLGQLASGSYQLRLRFRERPRIPNVPGPVLPGVVTTANFVVGAGPTLVTQVPALSPSAAAALSLLILGFGAFAVQRWR